jgi:hypothetical protein
VSAALVLPATHTVHLRCARCRTIDSFTVDGDSTPGRAPFAFCRVCEEPCTDLRAIDFEPDIHVACDAAGCEACRWTGIDQAIPECACGREVAVHRHGESLCTSCDAERESKRAESALRRRGW